MTEKQKIAANEMKYHMYVQAGCQCTVCHKHLQHHEAQLAHCISKSKHPHVYRSGYPSPVEYAYNLSGMQP